MILQVPRLISKLPAAAGPQSTFATRLRRAVAGATGALLEAALGVPWLWPTVPSPGGCAQGSAPVLTSDLMIWEGGFMAMPGEHNINIIYIYSVYNYF